MMTETAPQATPSSNKVNCAGWESALKDIALHLSQPSTAVSALPSHTNEKIPQRSKSSLSRAKSRGRIKYRVNVNHGLGPPDLARACGTLGGGLSASLIE